MKKFIRYLSVIILSIFIVGCSSNEFIKDSKITVISREDGSGTKDTFTNLIGVYEVVNSKKIENTTIDSDIIQSTGAIISSVESNKYAIGYISYGSLKNNVKALSIDGIEVTKENIKNGNYKLSRTFNIVINNDNNKDEVKDFVNFILSKQGQEIVEKSKYISKENFGDFVSTYPSGKITISGSSSVSPVIEKLKEAYSKINGNVSIELNQSDSTSGIENAISNVSDIGLASRSLSEKELKENITVSSIAVDALVVIVNKENSLGNLSKYKIRNIYQGKITNWKDV